MDCDNQNIEMKEEAANDENQISQNQLAPEFVDNSNDEKKEQDFAVGEQERPTLELKEEEEEGEEYEEQGNMVTSKNNAEKKHQPSKKALLKLLGITEEELNEALYFTQLSIIESERGEVDQQILKSIDIKDNKKIAEMLGITKNLRSFEVLEKMLGIPSDQIIDILRNIENDKLNSDHVSSDDEDDDDDDEDEDINDDDNVNNGNDYDRFIEEENCELEYDVPIEIENAISQSSKVQKLLGISPQQLKLMKKLGLSHLQLLQAQAQAHAHSQSVPVSPPLSPHGENQPHELIVIQSPDVKLNSNDSIDFIRDD